MAHYELKLIETTGNVNNGAANNIEDGPAVIGEIYDCNGNLLAWQGSSTLDWLEQDLLREVHFNPINDTYSRNW